MTIKEQIMTIAVSDPSYKNTIEQMRRQLANTNIVAEDLVEAIKMLELIIEDPRKYPEVRQAAIQDGLIDEGMFPPEFDKSIIISLLIVLYGMQDSLVQEGYSRGGLKVAGRQLDFGGQGGDTMLAHINPREAEVLRRMGGQGTVNPNTGLQEYKGLKGILKTALPIALSFALPGLGSAIGVAIGLSGTAAAVAGGALLGGATSFATGGDPLLGAIKGGFGGLGGFAQGADGLSSFISNQVPELASLIGQAGINTLTGAGLGAAGAAFTGGNIGTGAIAGAASSFVAPMIKNASTSVINGIKNNLNGFPSAFDASNTGFSGISDAVFSEQGSSLGDTFVDTNSYKPSMAIYSDNELMGGPNFKSAMPENVTDAGRLDPIDNVENSLLVNDMDAVTVPNPVETYNPTSISAVSGVDAATNIDAIEGSMPQKGPLSIFANLISSDTAKMGGIVALLASMDGGSGGDVGMPKLTKAQEEYFNRNLATWDWKAIQSAANAKGTSVTEFIINDKFRSEVDRGMFDQKPNYVTPRSLVSPRYARGGLSEIPGYATGSGDGRDDLINARLSDGEFVIDAESVSMLGNGSNKAGASILNNMRENLRSHKGKVLAKGRFSPDAKSPLEYMKRSA